MSGNAGYKRKLARLEELAKARTRRGGWLTVSDDFGQLPEDQYRDRAGNLYTRAELSAIESDYDGIIVITHRDWPGSDVIRMTWGDE